MALAERHKDPFEGWYPKADYVPAEQREETTLHEATASDIATNNRLYVGYLFRMVSQLQTEQKELKEKVTPIEEPAIKRVDIASLGNGKLELTRDIPITLEIYDDEVLAKFVDAEVTGFGETEPEALNSLKDNLVSLYYELTEDEANLGPIPKKWLAVLREIVRERW